ncbi:hypothetical protein K2173_018381 [Erythroxylum novogranatense]|uniref:Subtilisin-like protease SBT5.3 n=1 Tax=Erythroxylum novogranatense TaxID=1862640 RepID=A0AAV8UDU9_9ROSI|nr:hypothetical protein K2173_018381 [Erythroxylum novogranatense]
MSLPCPHLTLLPFLILFFFHRPTLASKRGYVVYLGAHSHEVQVSCAEHNRITESHYDFLGSFLRSQEHAKDAIFYSYTRHINGFAANLDENVAAEIASGYSEATLLYFFTLFLPCFILIKSYWSWKSLSNAEHPSVVSVFLNQGRKLHTTHSWSFLGLEQNGRVPSSSLWKKARFGGDVIIGNLDTGVWPESRSFSDEGYGPIPSKWKGICQNGSDPSFHCNRKLIGARYFNKGYASVAGPLNSSFDNPRDEEGHGSHTLSTAGGNIVEGAGVFNFGKGAAKGGSPRARVAAYKVCYPPVNGNECYDVDILAAFDAAIADGVDVLSVSLGGDPTPFFNDSVAIGSFHAVKHGIVVICSAGNSGPADGTVSNVAPWHITVGASTMDREFPSYVVLGNHFSYKGESLSETALPTNKYFPLMSAADARAPNASASAALLCQAGALDQKMARGKILVCLRGVNARVDKGEQAALVGAAGMVLANNELNGNEILADPHVLPALQLNYSNGLAVFNYINSTQSPVAYITRPKTQIGTRPAPVMAAFSSKGPNMVTPEILKPDITAPGVSIIAAYTEAQGPTNAAFDMRRVLFNSVSGTSMSCPHVSGIVGLLKTLHPSWSPAAIKSSIMTSARTKDNNMEPIVNASYCKATPFNYGAGHVRPNQAMDPGLVYDLTASDYLNFLCALGYKETQISSFSEAPYKCPSKPINLANFNYPSITVTRFTGSITITRKVKNVGTPGTYKVLIKKPWGISVFVEPESLVFKKVGEEKNFKVTLARKKRNAGKEYVFGELVWSDNKHFVRSPIVVK